MVVRIIIALIFLFTLFRIIIPYMLSSQSTELCIIACIFIIGIIALIFHRVEGGLKNLFTKKGDK